MWLIITKEDFGEFPGECYKVTVFHAVLLGFVVAV